MLQLKGFKFQELFTADGLARLDQQFIAELTAQQPALAQQLYHYRQQQLTEPLAISTFLLALAPLLEQFIAELFAIEPELHTLNLSLRPHNAVAHFKKELVLRRARHYRHPITLSYAELDHWLEQHLCYPAEAPDDRELAISQYFKRLQQDLQSADSAQALEHLTQWAYLTLNNPESTPRQHHWSSFKLPEKVDYAQLVPLVKRPNDALERLYSPQTRHRDGFKLTDTRMNARDALDEINYCVYCHEQNGDFCAKGFPQKKSEPKQGLKTNPLGEILTGCPLEEKISEMHWLKREGHSLAALAVIMIDNPMVPATGHRICNDCMKACIYQKQSPVNIPQAETRVLTDILNLPWGVEIYDLLTRWNPLRATQYCLKPYNGHKVLVAGLGPAGFSLVHHLTLEGCAVIGIDGLKIEPLPPELISQPIKHYADLVEPLDQRITWGFGGVAEYGITVRWDKNFLKLIYIALARRQYFRAFGGVRLGGTLTLDTVWQLGFNHVCIATGAGLPKVIPMGNSLAKGMRQASDFLMALQLTGAAKADSLANLQIRLPAIVIGGGLTAIDTATEIQPYYIAQVEKTLHRYETLVATQGSAAVLSGLGPEQQDILAEFLAHGQAIRAERQRAAAAGEAPQLLALIQQWGGVTVVYRRNLNESPAYLRNHEEVIKAMQEGIYYAEGLEPVHAKLDDQGHVTALICHQRHKSADGRWLNTQEKRLLPARAILIAAGATPNIIYEQEHPGSFALEGNHFVPHVCHTDSLQAVQVAQHCKSPEFGAFTSYQDQCKTVSFVGDTHPVFQGSVVKAIASAKRTYPEVLKALAHRPANPDVAELTDFLQQMRHQLSATVAAVHTRHPAVTEIIIQAPLAARNFQTGQIYRLQTFEQHSRSIQGNRLQIPPMTVSGAGIIDDDKVRLLVLQGGGASSRLATQLQPGDPLILMGPTGAPIAIPQNQTVMVIAGQWGASVMLDLGPALRRAGNRVLYFAAYRQASEVYPQSELEQAVDQVVWCTAQGDLIQPNRPQDRSVAGADMVQILRNYGEAPTGIALQEVDHLMIMGSTGLLKALASALTTSLKTHFKPTLHATGTVGSPMQCMLKGVCGQCLQWQINPDTGQRTKPVFACAQQDQPLFWIDLNNLQARQSQNYLPERLTAHWLNYLLQQESSPR